MRDAQASAANAASTAATTAGQYGAQAQGIGANLTPFLTRQMTNPQGMSQRDIGAQLTSTLAGTGGATAGLTGAASKMGADTRNPMGFSSALDAAAMQRDKGNAMAGEKIAANNADVKLEQQKQAASGLSGLYGMDVRGQTENAAQQAPDINAEISANKTGWLQNLEGGIDTGVDVYKALFPKGIAG